MNALLSWWDGVELWLTGQPFILQTVIVMPVVLSIACSIAVVGDRLLNFLLNAVNRLSGFASTRNQPPDSLVEP